MPAGQAVGLGGAWSLEMKGVGRAGHEESMLCWGAQALTGGPASTGLDWGGDVDTRRGQQDARLQTRELCCALGSHPRPVLISRQEDRARWHGQADKVTACT